MDLPSKNGIATRETLRALRCEPLPAGSAASAETIALQLRTLPGWALSGDALERAFTFADYLTTIAFVNAVAAMAEQEDHHPEMHVGYGRCTVRWNTHSAGGISHNDFICAVRTDDLHDRLAASPDAGLTAGKDTETTS